MAVRALLRLPLGVVRCALVVRLLDEWWSWLPAGTIEDQRADLGFTYAQAGWLLALLTVGGLVGGPLGALADRGHRRVLAAGGAAALAVGLAMFASGAPFAVLVVAATVLGAASDTVIRPLESSLAELADRVGTVSLDRLLGRQHLLTWLGDVTGPALLAVGGATVVGWRGVFAITAVAYLGYAVVLACTEFPDPAATAQDGDGGEDGTRGEDEASLWRSAVGLARRPEVLLLVAAEAILTPLDEAFLGFAVARAAADGVGPAAQVLAGGLTAGGIVGALVVARRGISRGAVRWGAAALVLGAGAAAVPSPVAAQVAAMAVLGAGTAVVWAKVHHRMLTVVPGRSATVPTVVGVLSTPALAVPVAMGVLSDAAGVTVTLALTATLAVPLAGVVVRLGGGTVTAAEVAALDD